MKRKVIIFSLSALLAILLIAVFLFPKKNSEEVEYYVIYSEKTTSESKGTKISAVAKFKGGGGYLYFDGKNYYVLLMAYKDLESANKVAKKIQDVKGVLPFKVKLNSDYQKYKRNIIDQLYDMTISYDRCEMTINEVKGNLATIKSGLFIKLENAQIEKNEKEKKEIEQIIKEVEMLLVTSIDCMSQRL